MQVASNRLVRGREDRRWGVGFRIGCRTSYRWRYVECELQSTAEAAFSCEGIPPEQALFQDRAEEGNDDNASVFTS
jgi:hypothetical protein